MPRNHGLQLISYTICKKCPYSEFRYWSVFSRIRTDCSRPATLLKKRLWRRCFPVNFTKFLRTPFFIEHLRWLLLNKMFLNNIINSSRTKQRNNTYMLVYTKKDGLMGVSLSGVVFMVCLQTLLLRIYFEKRKKLFAHPTSNYCESFQLKC